MRDLQSIREVNAMTFRADRPHPESPVHIYTADHQFVGSATTYETANGIVEALNDYAKKRAAANLPLWPEAETGDEAAA